MGDRDNMLCDRDRRILEGDTPTRYSVYSTQARGEVVEFWGNTKDGHIGVVEISWDTLRRLFGDLHHGSWTVGRGKARPRDATTIRTGRAGRYARPYAGSNRYMPLTFDLVKDGLDAAKQPARQPGTFLATYAWMDPEPDRYYLHLICVGPKGGTSYCNLWLEDLRRLLRVETPAPVLFSLSPDVVTLETTGRTLIDAGLIPYDWLAALERNPPHVIPGKDMRRKEYL
jgi:hypothetical protein